ncbi:MAG: hypothetical protein U0930_16325 [Pirellulales bacterium]
MASNHAIMIESKRACMNSIWKDDLPVKQHAFNHSIKLSGQQAVIQP